MNGLLGQRAVVVGAGVGGLSMAGALANCFEHVEILERDRLTASIGSRSGTPQDRHPHALLAGGLGALDEIFPGFADDLAGAGAVSVRVAQDIQFERPDVGLVPKRDFGISLLCASRPLIEFVLRGRVETIRNISVRPAVAGITRVEEDNAGTVERFLNCGERTRTRIGSTPLQVLHSDFGETRRPSQLGLRPIEQPAGSAYLSRRDHP